MKSKEIIDQENENDKVVIIEPFEIQEAKQRELMNKDFENETAVKQKGMFDMFNVVSKTKETLKTLLSFAGYCLYFYNTKHLNCKLLPLPFIQPTLRIREFSESFVLKEPAFYISGRPVFVCLRGFPVSIKMKLFNFLLVNEGYTSDEMDAILNSAFTERVFRAPRLSLQIVLLWLMSIITTNLITMMVYSIGD